jgi:hypothetical protein
VTYDSAETARGEIRGRFVFVAPANDSRHILPRMMSILLRTGLGALGVSLLLFVSCEEHYVGEYPEAQRDRVAEAKQANRSEQTDASAASPTPVEFFPKAKSP